MKPEWRTSTVLAICAGMRQEQDYSALPILADALQDAGCDDEKLLAKLRGNLRTTAAQIQVAMIYSDETSKSIDRLEQICDQCDVDGIEMLMSAAAAYAAHNDYLVQGGRWEGVYVPDDFWDHYETVAGPVKVWNEWSGRDGSFFSCSC